MTSMQNLLTCSIATALIAVLTSTSGVSQENQPIAIRHWPDGGVTIETMWDLHVGAKIGDETAKLLPRELDAQTKLSDRPGVMSVSRAANKSEVVVEPSDRDPFKSDKLSPRDVEIISNVNGAGGTAFRLNGVFVFCLNGSPPNSLTDDKKNMQESFSKLITAAGGIENWRFCLVLTDDAVKPDSLVQLAAIMKPELMIVSSKIDKVGEVDVEKMEHNTIAFSSAGKRKDDLRVVSLGTTPYKMSDEVAELFAKKGGRSKSIPRDVCETLCRSNELQTCQRISHAAMECGTHDGR